MHRVDEVLEADCNKYKVHVAPSIIKTAGVSYRTKLLFKCSFYFLGFLFPYFLIYAVFCALFVFVFIFCFFSPISCFGVQVTVFLPVAIFLKEVFLATIGVGCLCCRSSKMVHFPLTSLLLRYLLLLNIKKNRLIFCVISFKLQPV